MNKSLRIVLVIAGLILLGLLLKPASYPITNAEPRGRSVVSFGDSLTYGTGAAAGQDYPAVLAGLLGEPVINLGVPGNTTADALARLDEVIEQEPRIVLLTLGGNDLRKGVDAQTAFANLRQIVTRLQEQGALVVIGGLEIPLLDKGYAAAYRALAEETGSLLVANVLEDMLGDSALMSDQIHPNAQGYALMAGYFHRVLQPYLR
ncbi:MAG: arylesterase [Gammaproteobacteria bacterium]|nr:arylesterase [Gammaproteobacteria bacterium]